MANTLTRKTALQRRHRRIRRTIVGSAERPRLCVSRSLHHIVVQAVDDDSGRTLAAASTHEPDVRAKFAGKVNCEAAAEVGKLVAERVLNLGVKRVVFDRGGYIYHGVVKSLADAARAAHLGL